jgi:hypothetical protein
LRDVNVIILGGGEEVAGKRETFDANDLFAGSVNDARKVERVSIMIK